MKAWRLVVPLLLLLSLPAFGAEGNKAAATDFTLTTIDGKTVSLSDYLGKKVILLNFWATWCTPCKHELPHLQALYEKHKDEGLVVLGIAIDGPETVASVAPFARRQKLSYPVLLDLETRAVSLYNPRADAPFNVLIDRNGRIVSSRDGFNAGDEKAIEKSVVELLQKTAAEPPKDSKPAKAAE
jgi:peroxiredoxin